METALIKSEYEIERGKPMPNKNHAIVPGNIYYLLRQKYESSFRLMPEVSIIVEEKERVPDIAIFELMDFTPGNDDVKLVETPLNVVEMLSPKQNLADLIAKSYIYFQAGIKSYWLVLPDLTTIYVFSAPNEYEVFAKKGILKDPKIQVELNLEDIFK